MINYRGMSVVAVTMIVSGLLFGNALAHGKLVASNPTDGSQLARSAGRTTLVLSESPDVSQARVQQVGTAQPTTTPTGSARPPARSHTPKPLPEDMQRPIATGLLITFIVVIAVIMLHRRQHRRG